MKAVLPGEDLIEAGLRDLREGRETVEVWGTGKPRREFMHVDDLAAACYFLMNEYEEPRIINIGVGHDKTIEEIAMLIKKIVGFNGEIVFDETKPDGTPRKLLDVSKINELGWKASINLEEGINETYKSFIELFNDEVFFTT